MPEKNANLHIFIWHFPRDQSRISFMLDGIPMAASPGPWLVLDASSQVVRTGLFRKGRWLSLRTTTRPALESLFSEVHACLEDTGYSLPALSGVIYCAGPGSVLGLRLCAMQLRTWKTQPCLDGLPLLAFRSLDLPAALLIQNGQVQPDQPFHVVSESRQGVLNLLSLPAPQELTAGSASLNTLPIVEIPVGELPALVALGQPVFGLEPRRATGRPAPWPTGVIPFEPDFQQVAPLLQAFAGLLYSVTTPETFSPAQPTYTPWQPPSSLPPAPSTIIS